VERHGALREDELTGQPPAIGDSVSSPVASVNRSRRRPGRRPLRGVAAAATDQNRLRRGRMQRTCDGEDNLMMGAIAIPCLVENCAKSENRAEIVYLGSSAVLRVREMNSELVAFSS